MSIADLILPRLAGFLRRPVGEAARARRRFGASHRFQEEQGREPARRIALFGNFGTGNTGNECSLAAMIQSLRRIRPDAELTCICYVPEAVAKDHGIAAVPIKWHGPRNIAFRIFNRLLLRAPVEAIRIVRMIVQLSAVDVMILPGTGTLDDFGVPPFDWPYHLFKWCLAARLCNVRTAFVSTGAGPIQHPVSRWFLRAAARLAVYRSYRDEISRGFLSSIGVDTRNDMLSPDLVFSLRPPRICDVRSPGARPCVGVGVMSYYGWRADGADRSAIHQAYLEKMQRFILWLGDKGYGVRLLGGDTVDDAAHRRLLAMLRRERGASLDDWLVAEATRTPAQLLDQISKTDRVVASRYHNVLWALMMGKPVISIGYAEKNDVLMRDMALGAYCQQIEHLDVGRLISQFEEQMSRNEGLAANLRTKVQSHRDALREQELLLQAQLL